MSDCDVCKVSFKDPAALRHHKSDHHSALSSIYVNGNLVTPTRNKHDNTISCPFEGCGQRLANASSFKTHIKNKHGGENVHLQPTATKRPRSASVTEDVSPKRGKSDVALVLPDATGDAMNTAQVGAPGPTENHIVLHGAVNYLLTISKKSFGW